MRKYLFFLILLISCNSSNQLPPRYDELKTDLDRNFIYGNVESIELLKANFTEDSKTEEPIKQSFAIYDTSGYQIEFRKYDSFGKELSWMTTEYNDGKLTKQSSSFDSEKYKRIIINHYDSNGQLNRTDFYMNDSLSEYSVLNYDSHGNLTNHSQFNPKNILIAKTSFIYNFYKTNKFSTKLQIDSTQTGIDTTTYKNEYDKSDRLVESSFVLKLFGSNKSVNQYDSNGFIERITSFENGQIVQEKIYDKHYNILQINKYENAVLSSIFYYTHYRLDTYGNWIERTAKIENKIGQDKGKKELYKEFRSIKYYN